MNNKGGNNEYLIIAISKHSDLNTRLTLYSPFKFHESIIILKLFTYNYLYSLLYLSG